MSVPEAKFNDPREQFAHLLRALINENGYKPGKLAKLLNVSDASIYGWKGADPDRWVSVSSLEKYTKLLDELINEMPVTTCINNPVDSMEWKVNKTGLVVEFNTNDSSIQQALVMVTRQRQEVLDEIEVTTKRLELLQLQDTKLDTAIQVLRNLNEN